MICPHCHNNIPNGSNVCPLCFSSLNGVSDEPEANGNARPAEKQTHSAGNGMHGVGRTKSRKKKKRDLAPVIIAVGLIVVLIIFVALIVRSMFTGGGLFGGRSSSSGRSTRPSGSFGSSSGSSRSSSRSSSSGSFGRSGGSHLARPEGFSLSYGNTFGTLFGGKKKKK